MERRSAVVVLVVGCLLCNDRAEGTQVGAWISLFFSICQTGIALAEVGHV